MNYYWQQDNLYIQVCPKNSANKYVSILYHRSLSVYYGKFKSFNWYSMLSVLKRNMISIYKKHYLSIYYNYVSIFCDFQQFS